MLSVYSKLLTVMFHHFMFHIFTFHPHVPCSTFGVTGNKWRLAAKATCTTMLASMAGGIVSLIMSYIQYDGKIEVLATINGVLGALVSITGE